MITNRSHLNNKTRQANGRFLGALIITSIFLIIMSLLVGCQTIQEPKGAAEIRSSPTSEPPRMNATATPLPSATPAPLETFDIGSVEDWTNGYLLFDLEERSLGERNFLGVYSLDLQSRKIDQISSAGTQLLDISPDLKQILASREKDLFLIDIETGTEQRLADDYFLLSPSGAVWDPFSGAIYYLADKGAEISLQRIIPHLGTAEQIPADSPISLLSASRGILTWGKGKCKPFGSCVYTGLRWSDENGTEIAASELGDAILLPCQGTDQYVYAEKDQDNALSLHIKPHSQEKETVFWSLNTEYADCSWSPNGNQLAVTLIDRGWYSGVIQEYYFQLLVPETNRVIDLSYLGGALNHVSWSPDGQYTAFSGTILEGERYQIKLNLIDLEALDLIRIEEVSQFESDSYLSIHTILWTP